MNAFVEWLATTPLSYTLGNLGWVVPFVQTVHIIAIAVVLSSVLMIDLRVMGWAGQRQTLKATVRRFSPWFWTALVVLAVTGIVMILAEPVRELMAISFWVKMAVLVLGLTVAIVFLQSLDRSEAYWEETASVKRRTKVLGVLTFLVWCVVIFFGRFIAYDGQLWGQLSPLF